MKTYLLLCLTLLTSIICQGRHVTFVTPENQPIASVRCVGYSAGNDSIASWVSDKNGTIEINTTGLGHIIASHPDFNDRTILSRELDSESATVILTPGKELQEVQVEGEYQTIGKESVTYIPLKNQKKAAQDAVKLLSLMAIPQLDVDPVTKAVRTAHGEGVSIFIDYIPATEEDLTGMRTEDVKKVEFYRYPTDARFKGAAYAVNFIMQKYLWGGYTKLTGEENLGINITKGNVYSKMAYKRMTFDLYASEKYYTNRHVGQKNVETFNFTDLHGNGPQTITRTSETESSLERRNTNNVSMRAIYNAENTQITNLVSFNLLNTPHVDRHNLLRYSSDFLPFTESFTNRSFHEWSLGYNGEYYFKFSDQSSLNLTAEYTYGKNRSDMHYLVPDELSIVNNADERVNHMGGVAYHTWRPNGSNKFSTSASARFDWNSIDYTGSSPSRQKFTVGSYSVGQHYDHYFGNKASVGAYLSWYWYINRISGMREDTNSPMYGINASWSPTGKSQFYLDINTATLIAGSSGKSPNILQENELMWYTGTPGVKNAKRIRGSLSYIWYPNNTWQVYADANLFYTRDRLVDIYTPTGPDGTMLRRYGNSGEFYNSNIGMNVTGRFLSNRLVARLRPQVRFLKTTGEYAWRHNEFTCYLNLSYYLGDFYFTGWMITSVKYQDESYPMVFDYGIRYSLGAGWSRGPWNVSAEAYNFAHSSWKAYDGTLRSRYYNVDRTAYELAYHATYTITLTYTIGYGKKIDRGDELRGGGGVGSAILN